MVPSAGRLHSDWEHAVETHRRLLRYLERRVLELQPTQIATRR